MPSAFELDSDGVPFINADPQSDLDYSVVSWLEGLLFTAVTWAIVPALGVGDLHDNDINADPVVVDGISYAAGQLAWVWVKGMQAGVTYELTASATFTGNRKDERTFRIKCVER